MSKILYVTGLRKDITDLLKQLDKYQNLESAYFTRGYQSDGSNPIVDGDIAALGVTAAQVAAGITFMQQLGNMRTNQAVTQASYDTTINDLRLDI